MSSTLPPGPESRRLKMLGIALAAGGGVALGLLLEGAAEGYLALPAGGPAHLAGLAVAVNVIVAGVLVTAAGLGYLRPLPGRRRWPSLALQVALLNAALVSVLLGGLMDEQNADGDLADDARMIVIALAGYLLWLVAWRFWRRSRQYEAASAAEAMALDTRAPVLYLRAFRDDGVSLAAQSGSLPKRGLMRLLQLPTPEERAVAALAHVGPVIAIGKPGEPLPELGAARMYVSHDEWQQRVLELLRSAALVVLRLGDSPGILWEVEQTLASVPRRKLVLMLLADGHEGHDGLAPPVAQRLGPLLPALRAQDAGAAGRLVYFDGADALPQGVDIGRRAPSLRWDWRRFLGFDTATAEPMQIAWQRVLGALALQSPHRVAERSRAAAVLLAMLFGLFGAQWFYLRRSRRGWIYIATIPLLMAPLFVSWFDALRFLWLDRAQFRSRYARPAAG